jgi:hypothetical protein
VELCAYTALVPQNVSGSLAASDVRHERIESSDRGAPLCQINALFCTTCVQAARCSFMNYLITLSIV